MVKYRGNFLQVYVCSGCCAVTCDLADQLCLFDVKRRPGTADQPTKSNGAQEGTFNSQRRIST